jgi:predicted metal-binding membrane protein
MGLIKKLDFRQETPEDLADANRQTASLAGLAVALCLVVAGLFVFRALHAEAVLEDCLMSGQRGCGDITATK